MVKLTELLQEKLPEMKFLLTLIYQPKKNLKVHFKIYSVAINNVIIYQICHNNQNRNKVRIKTLLLKCLIKMLDVKNDLNTKFDNLIEMYLINLINFKLIIIK